MSREPKKLETHTIDILSTESRRLRLEMSAQEFRDALERAASRVDQVLIAKVEWRDEAPKMIDAQGSPYRLASRETTRSRVRVEIVDPALDERSQATLRVVSDGAMLDITAAVEHANIVPGEVELRSVGVPFWLTVAPFMLFALWLVIHALGWSGVVVNTVALGVMLWTLFELAVHIRRARTHTAREVSRASARWMRRGLAESTLDELLHHHTWELNARRRSLRLSDDEIQGFLQRVQRENALPAEPKRLALADGPRFLYRVMTENHGL